MWKATRKVRSKDSIPKKPGNRCYNLQFAFCDELKAYITGFIRSGNTYTANGAAEMIKEIVAQIKTDDLKILFRMDSGYFDDKIVEIIESAGCQYLIKGKAYPTLATSLRCLEEVSSCPSLVIRRTIPLFIIAQFGRGESSDLFWK